MNSDSESFPIRDDEIRELLAPLEAFGVIVLAVSGGADSTALMHLAARWQALCPEARRIVVATVDHGLRLESADEARSVASQAAALGFAHETLVWSGPKPETGIQEAAREARYDLLSGFAVGVAQGASAAVVTAHHRDDQVETFLMRLARGSGLDGLSGIAASRVAGGCTIVRPLLGVGKARLVASLKAWGASWIEDPSNARLDFERARLRQASSAALEALGLETEKINESVRRLQASRAALDYATVEFARAVGLDLHGGAYAEVPLAQLASAPGDLGVRLLARVVRAFGGQAEPPRLAKIEALWQRLLSDDWSGATLGGCVLARSGGLLRIYRESGRGAALPAQLQPGGEAVWDRRFVVGISRSAEGPAEVRQLGKRGYAAIRTSLSGSPLPPAAAAEMLPAFWRGGELVAVPPLAYVADKDSGPDAFRAVFVGL